MDIVKFIIATLVHILIAAVLSWYFYSWKRRDLLGGFIGGMIVSFFGGILGGFVVSDAVNFIIDFLQRGFYIANVNVIAGLIGGYATIYIFNKINHDRSRRDY